MVLYHSNYFSVSVCQKNNLSFLIQRIFHPIINTKHLLNTHSFLKKNIPTIFHNECFNNKNISFSEEVKSTEVGHLFEHLLLEYLKLEGEKKSIYSTYKGETFWNWSKYGYGIFKILISSSTNYSDFFNISVSSAIKALDNIYSLNTVVINQLKDGAEAPPFRNFVPLRN